MEYTLGVIFIFLKSGVLTSLLYDFFLIVRPLLAWEPPQRLFLINLGHRTQNCVYWRSQNEAPSGFPGDPLNLASFHCYNLFV